jgi:hypothetical protein
MVSVAVRVVVAVFAATLAETVALPVPPAAESVTHAASDVAVHAHPDVVVTDSA